MSRTQNESYTRESSFSEPTGQLSTSKGVLELGQALVNELGLDPGTDTLSRWMAHYIAELIHSAGMCDSEKRSAEHAACAEAILALWKHRHELPSGKRPFEDSEPILKALESLGLCDDSPRYFRPLRAEIDETVETAQTRQWLELADYLDYSARLLVRHCLVEAAETAMSKSRRWVQLVEEAGLATESDYLAIRFLEGEHELHNAAEPDDSVRAELESRINKLKAFADLAGELIADIQRRLGKAPN